MWRICELKYIKAKQIANMAPLFLGTFLEWRFMNKKEWTVPCEICVCVCVTRKRNAID
jgi:hypothetical protein